jgi:undecaprenyl-diphosphatase
MIGFSRIYLSVHFLSDVASGYVVGGFWLAVGVVVTEWYTEKRHVRQARRERSTDALGEGQDKQGADRHLR